MLYNSHFSLIKMFYHVPDNKNNYIYWAYFLVQSFAKIEMKYKFYSVTA